MATGRIQPQTPVKSVADADCFGFVRFMAMNANALGDYGSKSNIAFCQACGKAFIKRGNRQKYCETLECQSVRNNRKSSDYYRKKKDGQKKYEFTILTSVISLPSGYGNVFICCGKHSHDCATVS